MHSVGFEEADTLEQGPFAAPAATRGSMHEVGIGLDGTHVPAALCRSRYSTHFLSHSHSHTGSQSVHTHTNAETLIDPQPLRGPKHLQVEHRVRRSNLLQYRDAEASRCELSSANYTIAGLTSTWRRESVYVIPH